jgi:thioredoxin 1
MRDALLLAGFYLDFFAQSGYYGGNICHFCGGRMTDVVHISENDFQTQVLESTQPVMVDFTAVWCGPCKMLDPVVRQLAQDWEGKVKVVKLDVDENPDIAMQYQIMGVPTLMLFVNGQPDQRITGYQPKDRIVAKFSPHIG